MAKPPPALRDERTFPPMWALLDSAAEGEAVSAFLRLRELQSRRGQTFRELLERFEKADQLNGELGAQNAALVAENKRLRAKGSGRTVIKQYRDDGDVPVARPHDLVAALAVAAWWLSFIGFKVMLVVVAGSMLASSFVWRFSWNRFVVGVFLALLVIDLWVEFR